MNKLRTKPIKGLVIFALIVFVVSLAMILLFGIDYQNQTKVIAILVFIFCGAFFLVSLFVLVNQLFCYLELKNDRLIHHILWFTKSIKVDKINKITLEDGMYKIFSGSKIFYQMPSLIRGSNEIIIGLEKLGIHIN